MAKAIMNPKLEFFFAKGQHWREECEQLRMIALDSGLTEQLKWGCPCYTLDNSNIVLIHHFKDYCAMLFFKGALLKDTRGILIQQTANVQSARQLRFTSVKEITQQERTIRAYIKEAMEVEKAGLKVTLKKPSEFAVPDEFKKKLKEKPALKKAFDALTPGRQRAYLLHFAAAKQSATREARIEKYIPDIMKGKGLND